jgi:hypothetical protein
LSTAINSGGAGKCDFALGKEPAHEHADVGRVGGRALGSEGCLPGDGQDGPFPRVVERGVEPVGALTDGAGDVLRGALLSSFQRFCEAEKKVREHHARVPAGAEDGAASSGPGGIVEG